MEGEIGSPHILSEVWRYGLFAMIDQLREYAAVLLSTN